MENIMEVKSNIKMVQISEIKEYENNPRKKSDAGLDIVMKSIADFGFRGAIVIDKDNVILAGHTRFRAAKKLGFTELPCDIADELTAAKIRAYRLDTDCVRAVHGRASYGVKLISHKTG